MFFLDVQVVIYKVRRVAQTMSVYYVPPYKVLGYKWVRYNIPVLVELPFRKCKSVNRRVIKKSIQETSMLSLSYFCIALYNLQRFNFPYSICSSQQPWAVKETGTWSHSVSSIGAEFQTSGFTSRPHSFLQDPMVQLNTTK